MEKRYQIRIGTHKVDFHYDADTQTWRARRPGTQDYTTGQAGTLEAARDAVRRYIEDEEPAGESLHPRASPAGTRPVPRGTVLVPAAGESTRFRNSGRQETAGKGTTGNPFPAGRGRDCAEIRGNSVPQSRPSGKSAARLRMNHHPGSFTSWRLRLPGQLRDYPTAR
jgi:hypothetical protein